MNLILGDCRDKLKDLPDNSVDSIVTDPPYELGFMSKKWDSSGIAFDGEVWRECLRVLKPGGHLAAFSGTRTYHRMVVAIEDAGFEIRNQLMWVFGQGFPKGSDIGRKIDIRNGADGTWNVDPDELVWDKERDEHISQMRVHLKKRGDKPMLYTPADDAALPWKDWNTGMKPAHEPICLARKPFETVVENGKKRQLTAHENVLRWGTGAMNIGACRVVHNEPGKATTRTTPKSDGTKMGAFDRANDILASPSPEGRYPATILHDGSDAVTTEFPVTTVGNGIKHKGGTNVGNGITHGSFAITADGKFYESDSGSAARYFNALSFEEGELESLIPFHYCGKSSPTERSIGVFETVTVTDEDGTERQILVPGRNNHPTVKPIAVMSWLCNLLTPPGGTVLDPFLGSGTTGIAAERNGFGFIGIEMSEDYLCLSRQRIDHWGGRAPVAVSKSSTSKPVKVAASIPTLFS